MNESWTDARDFMTGRTRRVVLEITRRPIDDDDDDMLTDIRSAIFALAAE